MLPDTLSATRVGSGFRLVLPGRVPTKGNRPVPVRPGLVLPSKQYRKWIKDTEYAALALWARVWAMRIKLPIDQPLSVTATIYLPTRGRGDEDNYKKAIGDWLQKNNFISNDRLIHWRSAGIWLDRQEPRLELLVEPYTMRPGEL
jgi:Holliday junction resolvase RusA-like endonuclease